jgi:hypothetical protein
MKIAGIRGYFLSNESPVGGKSGGCSDTPPKS